MKNYKVKKYKNDGNDIIDIECTTVSFEKGSEFWWDAWLKEHKIKSKFKIHRCEWINAKKNPIEFDLRYDKHNDCFEVSCNSKAEKISTMNALGIFITSDGKDIYYKKPVPIAFTKGITCYSIGINGVISEVCFDDSDRQNELIRNKRLFTTFDEASKHTPKWTNMWYYMQRDGELLTEMLHTAAEIENGLCNVGKDYFVVCYNCDDEDEVNIYSKNIKDVNSTDEVFLKHALKFNSKSNAELFIKEERDSVRISLY